MGDRAARGSATDLLRRLEGLPHGHPSSPYHDDGTAKPALTRLKELELPLPPGGAGPVPGAGAGSGLGAGAGSGSGSGAGSGSGSGLGGGPGTLVVPEVPEDPAWEDPGAAPAWEPDADESPGPPDPASEFWADEAPAYAEVESPEVESPEVMTPEVMTPI